MRRTTQKTKKEGMWKCSHCNSLNNLSTKFCSQCGAPREANSEMVEVTTDYERNEVTSTTTGTTDTETTDFFPSNRRKLIYLIVILLFLLTLILSFSNRKSNVTVTDKYWKYTVTVFRQEYEHQTSAMTPPPEAINIIPKQVRKSNGWSQVEYQYDILVWKEVDTIEFSGKYSHPTFQEYKIADGEKISISDVAYYVTFVGQKGTRTERVSKEEWNAYMIGNTYPDF